MKKILISLFVLPALLAASQQFPTQAMHKYRTVLTEEQKDAAAVEIFNALHKRCLAKVPSKEFSTSSKSTALSPVENKWLWRRTHDGQLRITPEEVKAINKRAIPLLLVKFKKQAEEEQGKEGESWTARQMRSFVWQQFGLEESATNVIYVPSKKNSRYKRAFFPLSVYDISTDTCCVDERQSLSLGLCCLTSLDGIQAVKGANDGCSESGLRHLTAMFNSFGKRGLQPLSGLQYLQTLDVTGSHFTLKKGKFPRLPFLQNLILYHNNVPKLKPGMLDLPALKELDVRQCNLACVMSGAFDQCPQLKKLIVANVLEFILDVHDTPLWQDAVRNARGKRARDNAIKCLFRGTLQDDVMVALRALCHVPDNVEVS